MNNILNLRNFYIALAAIPVLLWIACIVVLASSPYMGITFEHREGNYYITAPDNLSINNKKITAIGGYPIAGKDLAGEPNSIWDRGEYNHFWEARKYLSSNIHPDQPVNITIDSRGGQSNIQVTPTRFTAADVASSTWVNLLITLVTVSIGLIIALKKVNDVTARVFFIGTLLLSIHNTTLSIYNIGGIILNEEFFRFLMIINSVTASYTVAALLYFYLIFPKGYKIITNQPFNILVFWTIPLINAVLFFFRITYFESLLVILAYIAVALFISARSYFGLESPVVKNQVRWVFIGMALLVMGDVVLYIIPLMMGRATFSYYFLSLIPILAAVFAVNKYHLMDIDSLFDYAIIYSVTIGLLSLIDIVIITSLTNFGIFNLINKPIVVVILVWVTIIAYVPVRDRSYRLIKKLFKREEYDINQLTMQLQQEILLSPDVGSVLQSGIGIIDKSLHPKKTEILYPIDNETIVIMDENKSAHLNEIGEITPVTGIIKPDAVYENYQGGLLVPIRSSDSISGYFVLQDKQSGNLYSKEDMRLLSIIAGQAGLAISAIQNKEALQKEKERISREIHDGIGSNLTKAILISENIRSNRHPDQNEPGMKELTRTLNESLNDIRELIWTVENRENTLDDVVSYIFEKIQYLKNQGDIDFALLQDVQNKDSIISPTLKLNIVRIIQESITNILKHAQATRISLSLIEQRNMLTISIQDNGVGFDTDKISQGYGLKNMRKRAEESKGVITITSEQGTGTRTEVVIPLFSG